MLPRSDVIVAFQGEVGAYSEAAAYEHFTGDASAGLLQALPCPSFEAVFEAVMEGRATHAMLPFENSLAGSIHRNYDLALRHDLRIVGEHHLRVSHCLLVLPGVKLIEIKLVRSHPQALAQCEGTLTRLGLPREPAADTAGSARELAASGARAVAAIASRRAAAVYGLDILLSEIEDNPNNYTRFLALTRSSDAVPVDPAESYKTSLVFTLNNRPGALFKALSVFALRDIDLTKIESRPIAGKPWEYLFYVDVAAHAADPACARALLHLEEIAPMIRVLGSYPRHVVEYPEDS